MADVKISALPAATTPLAGTEVLPIVQSSTTKKVAISDVTAGRAISASSLTLTTTPLVVGSGGTGLTSLTAGRIPYGNGTGAFSNSANLTYDGNNFRSVGVASASAVYFDIGNNAAQAVGDAATLRFLTSTAFVSAPTAAPYISAIQTNASTSNTDITFGTFNGVTLGERMRIASDGSVGIGTTSPQARLDVYAASNGTPSLGSPTFYSQVWKNTVGTYGLGVNVNAATGIVLVQSQRFDTTATAYDISLQPLGGNVGIGTTSPSQKLHVYGNILSDTASSTNYYAQVAGTTYTQFLTTASATTLKTIVANPLILGTNDTERARIDSSGNVVINTAAIATSATDGFLYVPTCAGTPTGTPTTYTGRAPIVVNTTNNKLYFYSGGAWRDAGP